NLAAGFGVERRLVDDDADLVAENSFDEALVAAQYRLDHPLGVFGLVAEELARPDLVAQCEPVGLGRRFARADPGGARTGPRLFHSLFELGDVDGDAARPQDVLRQVEWKAVGVVEREGDAAVERFAVLKSCARRHFLQQRQTPAQRLPEALLFEAQRLA